MKPQNPLAAELYHRAAERKVQLGAARAAALAATRKALAAVLPPVRRAAVLGKTPKLPDDPEKILASHPAIHTAEGELWRALSAEALGLAGVAVTRAMPSERLDARWLAEQGARLGPPWNAELKAAATAARTLFDSRA